jgi:hypothetical protein
MLRKCKAGAGAKARPAFFHGWFQFGNAEGGMDGMAVVEYEDGTTDYFSPGYIVFDTPPTADTVEGANLQHTTGKAAPCQHEIAERYVCVKCGGIVTATFE